MEENRISRGEKIIETRKKRARSLSIYEASAYSVSEGFGLRNVAPYALALNASNSVMGFLTSIPTLLGNLSQLITYSFLGKFSRKKIVMFGVLLQSLFWLMLIIPGLLFLKNPVSDIPAWSLVAIYTMLIIAGAFVGPAWNSWMKDIVPREILGRYFAKRSRIAGFIVVVSMLIAGFLLDYFKKIEVLYGFFILLFFSFIFRGMSGYLFKDQYEPPFKKKKDSFFGLLQFVYNMPFNNFGRFVVYVCLMNLVVAIAGPFFAVYLLRERGINYAIYMFLIMMMPVATMLTLNFWGKISDKFGNVKVFRLTGFFMAIIPMFYFISNYFESKIVLISIIAFIELISGVSWGGFNLSVSNFLFKTASRDKMVICSSYLNVLNGFAVFIGATIGGMIASVNFWKPIMLVFLISGIGRLLVYFLILPGIKEVVHKKSKYDKYDFLSSFNFAGRFFSQIGESIYFKRHKNNKLNRFSII